MANPVANIARGALTLTALTTRPSARDNNMVLASVRVTRQNSPGVTPPSIKGSARAGKMARRA
jgi:hypothetical protein